MSRKIGHACGKIILSGNTANRFGKRALAVPVDMQITATWDNRDKAIDGLRIIWPGRKAEGIWLTTVRKIMSMIEPQIGPVSGTLTIRNTLHLGKGMGSSTAIVIALARCFLGKNCKEDALAIEDVINRGHSGLDFAVIWEEQPIVIQGKKYEFTELPKGLQRGFLIDTGLPAAPTSIIVRQLKERLTKEKVLMDSVETIGDCTERLLCGEDPLTVFPDQYNALVNLRVVPPQVQSLIKKIQQSGGAAKPGRFGDTAGGVGMVFAVHPKPDVLKEILGSAPVLLVYDASLSRFIITPEDTAQSCPEPLHTTRTRLRRTSVTTLLEGAS
jgi:GHMP kinases N terminal domain